MEEEIIVLLNGVTTLYPLTLPEGVEVPATTFQRINTLPEYHHSGNDTEWAAVQLSIYARTLEECRSIAQSIKVILSGYSGGNIQSLFKSNQFDGNDPETGLLKVVAEYAGYFKEQ